MDLKSFAQAIKQIAEEKAIPREKIFETIEMALAAAYKRDYGKKGQIIKAKMDPETAKVTIKQIKIVVDESMIKSEEEIAAEEEERAKRQAEILAGKSPEEIRRHRERELEMEEEMALNPEEKKIRFNPEKHLMLEEAQKIKADIKLGEELEFPLEYHEEYGRIAAQTAKQVIIQRIREIEREVIFDEYKNKEGEVLSGIIQRVEGRNVFVDLGRSVGVLPAEEQIPHERYNVGERIKALVIMVERSPKGPGIFLSRSHPRLLKKLFEIEVPEIASGVVEIKAIAREAGSRTKVAVTSHEEGIDPVGSLVGQKGVRVSTVINELGGEKIDVVEWSESPNIFISNALSPAKVLDVETNEDYKEARVIVPEEQLSLAIGKGGQNVRLAAKLTGWKIDARSGKTATEVKGDVKDEETSASKEENTEEKPASVSKTKKGKNKENRPEAEEKVEEPKE